MPRDPAPPQEDILLFLKRAVEITTLSWTTSTATQNFAPWTLWRAAPTVLRRLVNNSYIRGDLHLKIVWNTTPYHMGLAYLAILPANCVSYSVAKYTASRISTLPGVWMNANTGNSCELVVPYFNPDDYIPVQNGDTQTATIAQVIFKPFVAATRADGVAPGTISVQVFAWLENAKVFMPTAFIASSSKDKPSTAQLSTNLLKVAAAATSLSSVPVIGPYFDVGGRFVANVGKLASFFGFSSQYKSVFAHMIPNQVGNMAICDQEDIGHKLTVCQDNTIDIGEDGTVETGADVLAVASLASIPMYILSFGILPADAPGTVYATIPITPMLLVNYSSPQSCSAVAPCGFAASFCDYWAGSLIYNIKVVSSPYIKGRLLIWFYPEQKTNYNSGTMDNALAASLACVVNLENDREYDLVINNSDSSVWSETTPVGFSTSNGTGTTVIKFVSGTLAFQLKQQLIAPTTTGCSILVTMRGGPDFQINSPSDAFINNYDFISTSSFVAPPNSALVERCELVPRSYDPKPKAMAYFGEVIPSIRLLLKRYIYETSLPLATNAPAGLTSINARFVQTLGPQIQTTNVGGTLTPVYPQSDNRVYKNTFLSYAAAAFSGWRGSIRVKIVPMTSTPYTLFVSRSQNNSTTGAAATSYTYDSNWVFNNATSSAPPNSMYRNIRLMLSWVGGHRGVSISRGDQVNEFTSPHYTNTRFHVFGTNLAGATSYLPTYQVVAMASSNAVAGSIAPGCDMLHVYKAAGDDYNMYGWIGNPEVNATTAFQQQYSPATAMIFTGADY